MLLEIIKLYFDYKLKFIINQFHNITKDNLQATLKIITIMEHFIMNNINYKE